MKDKQNIGSLMSIFLITLFSVMVTPCNVTYVELLVPYYMATTLLQQHKIVFISERHLQYLRECQYAIKCL